MLPQKIALSSKVTAHPVQAFFLFAFLISWTIWFLAPTISGGNAALANLIDLIAANGPALSAVAVAATVHPEPSGASPKKRQYTFTVVFALIYLLELAALFISNTLTVETALAGAVSVAIAAYIVSSVYHPKAGVANLMSGLKRVSPRSVWIWVAISLPFLWQLAGLSIAAATGQLDISTLSIGLIISGLLSYPVTFFFGGPLNEEPGWRGFALPHMQTRLSPLLAGLAIGVIWTIWHFPLHFNQFYGDGAIGFLLRFSYTVPFGVLFAWIYNRSGGNLFACIMLHTSINVSSAIFGASVGLWGVLVMVVLVAAMVMMDKMYRGQPHSGGHGSPPIKQVE